MQNDRFITLPIDIVIWFYAASQADVFDEMRRTLKEKNKFVHGLPESAGMDTFLSDQSRNKLFVFDNLMEEASERVDVKHLFTRGRHYQASVMFLTQNLYHKGKHSREISLNSEYIILFKNPRDKTIVTNLGKQMGNVVFLQWAYKDATEEPFSYLFIDLHADTDNQLRFCAKILNDFQIVYLSSKMKEAFDIYK